MNTDITQIRQGDVLLIRRPEPRRRDLAIGPDGLPVQGVRIEGERTGHAHELLAEVYDVPGGARMVAVWQPTLLTHQEHEHVLVPAGWWEVRVQREWVPTQRPTRRYD